MELAHTTEAYLTNQPMLRIRLDRELTPVVAVFHGEGDFFMVSFEGVSERVCDGCAAKASFCPTWGTCDWENVRPDDLEEFIEELEVESKVEVSEPT